MRLLQLHCEYFRYWVTKPALKTPVEHAEAGEVHEFKNVLVVLTTVEKSDTPETARNAITAVKKNFDEVKADVLLIYPYAHLSSDLASPAAGLTVLKEMEAYAKHIKLNVFRSPFGYYKGFELKCYGHPLAELSKTIN
jgi:threonyl-tRNA synthetase